MAETKKYLAKINKDGKTIYLKDEEARSQLPSLATENAVRGIVTNYGK